MQPIALLACCSSKNIAFNQFANSHILMYMYDYREVGTGQKRTLNVNVH